MCYEKCYIHPYKCNVYYVHMQNMEFITLHIISKTLFKKKVPENMLFLFVEFLQHQHSFDCDGSHKEGFFLLFDTI